MPNYTWNTIEAKPEVIKKLLNEKGEFTFNNFVPCPTEIENTTSGGRVEELIGLYIIENYTLAQYKYFAEQMHIHTWGLKKNATKKEIKAYFENRLGDERVDKVTKGLNGEIVALKTGKDYFDLFTKYGCLDWYSWHNRYWGTKWDAFEVDVDKESIRFTTAWCSPEPIFMKICEMFPDEKILFNAEYEDNLYIEASNHNGIYVEDATYRRNYPDNFDWDNDDYEDIPWTNVETGEVLAS